MRPYTCFDVIPTAMLIIQWAGTQVRPCTRAVLTASHIGVFGEGSGEGVFAKTPSPATLSEKE